jgi:hypothetical protein
MSEENTTIADELAAVWNEAEAETETVEAAPPEDVSEPQEVAEAEDGEDTPIEENEVPAEAEEASEDMEPETVFQAPEHWSSEDKAAFERLTDEAKELTLKFESDFKRGYQERVQSISEIQQAIEPWKGMVAQLGVSEAQAIRTLFAAYNQLLTNPLQGVQNLAQTFGVLDQINAPDTDDDFIDPEIKALRQQVQALQGGLQNFQQQQANNANMEAQNMVAEFKAAKDAQGNLKHPYFDEATPMIATLIREGKTLEEAYQEAVWSVPQYRESHIPKQKTPEEKAAKVRRAKKAAASVKTGKGTPTAETANLSLEDELRATWNELAS